MPPHEDVSSPFAPPDPHAAPPHLKPGRTVGDLVVGALIGRGGTSEVYRVHDPRRGTVHALKVLDPRIYTACSARYREMLFARLRREGRLQQAIRHENVVRVERVVELPEGPALLMECVDGPTLDVVLRHHRVLVWDDLDDIAQGLLAGLVRAQRAGVVHRDIKPGNVLLARTDGRWVPKLTDFGFAKLDRDRDELTLTGQVMGTPGYMPPTQMDDAKHVDGSVDTYAMGVVLYELATGERLVPAWQPASPELVGEALRSLAERAVPKRAQRAIALALAPGRRKPDARQVLTVWRGAASRRHTLCGWGAAAALGGAVVGMALTWLLLDL